MSGISSRKHSYISRYGDCCSDSELASQLQLNKSAVAATRKQLGLGAAEGDDAGPRPSSPPPFTYQATIPPGVAPIGRADWILCSLCALAVFVVYVSCIGPTVTGEDSGELIAAAYSLGIPHPPGYPLWCLIGKLFTYLPFGSVAWRIGLMSATFGAGTVFLLSILTRKLTGSIVAALVAGVAAGLSREFWEQSTIAEVYALNAFFMALCMLLLWLWYEHREDRYLYTFALAYGLSLCNHNTMLLLGPAFLAFLLYIEPLFYRRWKTYLLCLVLAGISLSLYLYLPIRSLANPPIDWGNPETWENFWAVVRREQYAFLFVEHGRSLPRFLEQAWTLGSQGVWQIGPWLAWLPVLGLVHLLIHRKVFGAFLLICLVFLGPVLLFLQNFELNREQIWVNTTFFIPVFLLSGLLTGAGTVALFGLVRRRSLQMVIALAVLLATAASPLYLHYAQNNKGSYFFTDDYARNLLDTMEENAILFPTSDHATFPALYLQIVKGYRPDVTLGNMYGYPEPSLYEDMPVEWAAQLPALSGDARDLFVEDWVITHTDRPVYFTRRRLARSLPEDYQIVPYGLTFRVIRPGETAPEVTPWDTYTWHSLEEEDTHGELSADYVLADYHYMRGWDALTNERPQEALEHFEQTLALGGGTPETYNNVASACAENHLYDDAERYFREAISLDPGYASARRNLAKVLMQQEDYPHALEQFETLLRENLDQPDLLLQSARCLVQVGWHEDAIRRLQYLLQLTPRDPAIYREVGMIYASQLRNPAEAREYFARSLELDPDQPELRQYIAERAAEDPNAPPLPLDYQNLMPQLPNVPLPGMPSIPGLEGRLPTGGR